MPSLLIIKDYLIACQDELNPSLFIVRKKDLLFQLFQPRFYFLPDGLPDLSGLFQFFFLGSGKAGGIDKTPMETGRDPWEKGALLGTGLIADRNHMGI
jgi:hypothetical protein